MKENDFNEIFNLYKNSSILSLRKYEEESYPNIEIFEFNKDDFEKINKNKKIIKNIPSIYILENIKNKKIYIGETENLLKRIKDHIKDPNKDFNKIYVISSEQFEGNILLKLESKTIKKFKNSINNYDVSNKNEENNPFLSKQNNLKFEKIWKKFEEIYFLLGFNLNQKNYEFINEENEKIQNNENKYIENKINKEEYPIFYYKSGKLKIVDEGFLLLKGSKIFTGKVPDYAWKQIIKHREKMISENTINKDGILLKDYFLKNSSLLASLIKGTNGNGFEDFKTKDGKKLRYYLEKK